MLACDNLSMDVAAYLSRIGLTGSIAPDLEGLEHLQRAHLTHVPFENLDVFHRRGVATEPTWSVLKIVERGRGGWCYELNGAFAALLAAVGYRVTRLGATVLLGDPSPTPDHLAVEVTLDRPYLVDVGFGDSFIRPLPLDAPGPHDGGTGDFGFRFDGEHTTLLAFGPAGAAEPQYRFDRTPRTATDFDPASHRLQTEPGLRWTEAPFATRLLDGGPDRVTLLHDRVKFRRNGEWTEDPVTEDEWPAMLHRWFGMTP